MKTYLGILGDPAKLGKYNDSFYSLLDFDTTNSVFYLLGASERDVGKSEYRAMYLKLRSSLEKSNVQPLNLFTNAKDINSRIGLFPSSPNHIISGPGFILAPYPANSSSYYLKYKARFLIKILSPFVKAKINPIAYFPFGGKAANRTRANLSLSIEEITKLFQKYRANKWFKWYYLEAGSGEEILDNSTIQSILRSQLKNFDHKKHAKHHIVPRSIYGGGIKDIRTLDSILLPRENNFVPHCIIVGNISEDDISVTIKMIERLTEINLSR